MWNSSEARLFPVITYRKMSEKIGNFVILPRGLSSTSTKREIKIETPKSEFPEKFFNCTWIYLEFNHIVVVFFTSQNGSQAAVPQEYYLLSKFRKRSQL